MPNIHESRKLALTCGMFAAQAQALFVQNHLMNP
jgi:hypothetical protein